VQTLVQLLPQFRGIYPTQLMYYSVQVKRNPFAVYTDYTFEDTYFQGCEKVFDTEQEALEYFQSFEDWEQDLLVVDYHPF
jgi:hypothetical protein